MDFDEYKELMDDFYNSSGIDRPASQAISSWFEHLNHLKLSTLSGVLNKMKIELDRRPYNMLNKIREYAVIYLKENPQARGMADYAPCDYCKGEGVFFVEKANNANPDQLESSVILCGHCENWKKKYGGLAGKLKLKTFEIEYQGYTIMD